MYSLVLMAALATTAEAPAWGHGCCGCHGSWHGCHGGWYGCHGCYGGWYGCYGCGGGCYGYYGGGFIVAPVTGGEPKKDIKSAAPEKAKVLVELPDDAKLYIDDDLMAPAKRSFNTPPLARGQAYYYMVRAEVVRDGKSYSETKRMIIRAGDTAKALFPEAQLVRAENEMKAVASR